MKRPAETVPEGKETMMMNTELKPCDGGVCAAKGFRAAGIHAGLRKNKDKLDLALIVAEKDCATAWGCDLSYEYVHINGDYRS